MTSVGTRAAVRYRAFRDDDLPGVLTLWEEAGWGQLDDATWRQWYRDTPYGNALIWVVESASGEILGKLALTPSEVNLPGRTVKAVRVSLFILHPRLRGTRVDREHPFVELMAAAAVDIGGEGVYALGYGFPHPVMYAPARFVAADGILPVQLWRLPCHVVHATRNTAPAPGESVIDVLTEEHEALAAGTASALGAQCHVRRSLEWMRWRIGGDRLVELRTGTGELDALAAIRGRDGLVSDLHVLHESYLVPVLAASARLSPDGKVVVPGLPVLLPALERLQAEAVAARLAFACWSYDESLVPSEEIAPERWLPMHAD